MRQGKFPLEWSVKVVNDRQHGLITENATQPKLGGISYYNFNIKCLKRKSFICWAGFLSSCFLFLLSTGWPPLHLTQCKRVAMMSFTAAEEIENSELRSWQEKTVLHLISKQVFK